MKLTCPKCKHLWEEELTPGEKVRVHCPHCKASFVTMTKSKASPAFVQSPPRSRPQVIPPEVTQSYVGLVKLAHHNQLISFQAVQQLLKRQPEAATFRDIFEIFVNGEYLNPAEFDAFRVLLESPKIQELLLIINLQEKKGPVILGKTPISAPPKSKDLMHTLADEDEEDLGTAIRERMASGSITLQDDDDDDFELPQEITSKIAGRVPKRASTRSLQNTLVDEDGESRQTVPDEDFPEVPTSHFNLNDLKKNTEILEVKVNLPDTDENTRKFVAPSKNKKAKKQDDMITMVESTDFDQLREGAASLETHHASGRDVEKQDTFVQMSSEEDFMTEVDMVVAPKETGKELLALVKKRNAVRVFHHYEIEREIARNENAIVFFVEQFTDPYCLKVFFYDDEDFKEKRLKEVTQKLKIIQNLRHANIVDIIDIGTFNEVPYLLTARNTSNTLDRIGEFEPPKLLQWIQIVAQTLLAAHKKGVVHGNLKPRNILLAANERVYLTDFCLFGGMRGDYKHIENINPFALAYVPPELLQGKPVEEIAPTVDIYALGVILYEMFSGETPFKGDNVVKITYNKMNKQPKSLTELIRLDPNYNQLIENCMHADPVHRYAELEQFLQDLDKVLHGKNIKPVKKGGLFGLF